MSRWDDPGMSPGTSRSQGPAGGATMGGGGGYSDRERVQQRDAGGPPGITTTPTHIPTQPTDNRGERINTWLNEKMPNLRHKYNFNKRGNWIDD